jgi:hypothetical protein
MEVGIGDPLKSEVPRGSFFGLFPIPFSTALPGFLRADLSLYGIHSKPNGLPLKL